MYKIHTLHAYYVVIYLTLLTKASYYLPMNLNLIYDIVVFWAMPANGSESCKREPIIIWVTSLSSIFHYL